MQDKAPTKEALEEMQARVLKLEQLASLGELIGGIAHEIKNPISFIKNFAELSIGMLEELRVIFSKPYSEEQRAEALEIMTELNGNLQQILSSSDRVTSIVQHMRSQSKNEKEEFTLTDINKLLDESAMLTYHGIRAKNNNFNVKFEKSYDPLLTSFYTIEGSIGRVFLNLFSNAYFTVEKKKEKLGAEYEPLIRITSKKIDNTCEIRICDNGEGISDENKGKIFTPFFTTKTAFEGTGLGLSLSYNTIVKNHQGTLAFNSEEGQFTEFILTLPIRREP